MHQVMTEKKVSAIPFAKEYHCKTEEMQVAWLVRIWHTVQPVSHGTDLLT